MRGLLSAARRTGVLGKPNASPAPIAPSNLLPCRRVPSPGLRCPTASLREARKTAAAASAADRLHHHRRRRLPSSRATAPSSAASPAPAAPGDESQEAYFGDLTDHSVVANNTGLQLLFLGTGAGPAPTRRRGSPCIAVRTMHNSWLFDCGDDSQRALVREVSLGPSSSSSSSSSPSPSPSPSAAAGKGVKRKAGGGRGGGRAEPEPVASAPVRHGRISSFFVTSRFSGGALGLPGMLCIASASRVVKGAERAPVQNNSGGGNGSGSGLPPTSVSVFGPPGIANFLNEMLTLSDTYLAMPVLVHEFGYGSNSSSKGKNGIASTVAPSQRGKGAVPVPRLLSRRAKLSVATLLPDELNPFGFYDLERAPKPSTPSQQGSEGFDPLLKKTRTVDPEEADRLGFGFGFDARSGIRGPDCLPGPGDPARADANGLLRDPATATWTLRFDREFVVRCVPLIAPADPSKEKGNQEGETEEEEYNRLQRQKSEGSNKKKAAPSSTSSPPSSSPVLSAAQAVFASAPGPDALAYVIRESARAGRIDAELAVSLGVTRGPMMAELKAGRSVTVVTAGGGDGEGEEPTTRVIRPEEVVSPERPGRVVAILGDPLPPRSDAETMLPPSPFGAAPAAAAGLRGVGGEAEDGELEREKDRERGRERARAAAAAAAAAEARAFSAALAALSAVVEVAREADLFVAGASSAAAAATVADRAGASALVLTRFGKGDPGGGDEEGDGEGEEVNEEEQIEEGEEGQGSESDDGSGKPSRRRKKKYTDEDLAAEAKAVLAARDAAPRLSAKVAAARDLDTVVLSRREPEFEGAIVKKDL